MNVYELIFTDKLNQRVLGGRYISFVEAVLTARAVTGFGVKATWQIIRLSDKVTLAQSKEVQA